MLVSMVHSIKLESLLKLITSLLEVSSSMKGQVGNHPSSNKSLSLRFMFYLWGTFFLVYRRLKTACLADYLHMELLQDQERLLKNGFRIIILHLSKNLSNVLLILQLKNGTYKSLLLQFYWR